MEYYWTYKGTANAEIVAALVAASATAALAIKVTILSKNRLD
jgi:hypothetical protein